METLVSLQTLIAAIVGGTFGALTAWITRRADREAERERLRDETRRHMLTDLRGVIEADDTTIAKIRNHPAYRRLLPDISPAVAAHFQPSRVHRIIAEPGGGRLLGPQELLDDLARLEREWDLT